MEIKIEGIKCDNTECGWSDMSVKFEDYYDWLNRPCPNCSQNILTEENYIETLSLKDMELVLSSIVSSFNREFKIENAHFKYDGKGLVFKTKEFEGYFHNLILQELYEQSNNSGLS